MKKIAVPVIRVIALFIALHTASAHADDFQQWNAIAMTAEASADSDWLLWFDGHARFTDDASELGVTILRPGIGYRVADTLSLWLGYARVTLHPGENIDEDRIWQQATYPLGSLLGGGLSGRSRLEQRFRDGGSDTGHRFRQFLRWSRPLGDSNFSVVLWDELFVGLNDTEFGQPSGFDQNRAFVGLAMKPSPRLRAEFGYLNNRIRRSGPDQTNHILSLTLFVVP